MFTPVFTITPKLLNLVSGIAETKTLINYAKVLPQREAVLRRQSQIKIAFTSTQIEGSPLAEYEAEKILSGEQTTADHASVKLLKNYEQALQLVESLSHKETITDQTVLTLHKVSMKEVLPEQQRGHWRTGPLALSNQYKGKDTVTYICPEPQLIPLLMDELLAWIAEGTKDFLHPVLLAGLIHHQFEAIHPFTDGNGQVGRLLTLLYLQQKDWDFKHLITLEHYYAQDKQSYLQELEKTGKTFGEKQRVDLTGWLEYFTQGFLEEAAKVKEVILPLTVHHQPERHVFLDQDELQIIDFLASAGQMRATLLSDVLAMPKRTAQAKIKGLVDKNILLVHGKGPATYYTLKQQ